jgi:hypothetical protein
VSVTMFRWSVFLFLVFKDSKLLCLLRRFGWACSWSIHLNLIHSPWRSGWYVLPKRLNKHVTSHDAKTDKMPRIPENLYLFMMQFLTLTLSVVEVFKNFVIKPEDWLVFLQNFIPGPILRCLNIFPQNFFSNSIFHIICIPSWSGSAKRSLP